MSVLFCSPLNPLRSNVSLHSAAAVHRFRSPLAESLLGLSRDIRGNVLESRKLLLAADLVSEPLPVRVREGALQPFGFILGQRRLCLHPSNQPGRDNIRLFFTEAVHIRTAIPAFVRQEVLHR